VTRLLGFGAHGQGSVMALASFGAPTVPFDEHLGVREPSRAARDGRIERRDADEGDADVGGADAGAGDADAGEAAGRGRPTLVVHEQGLDARYADRRRAPDAPLEARHHDLAASLQHGLERVAIALLARNAGEGPLDGLCLAGGVMLNCRMNERLRRTFRPAAIFAQSGANDAGTALGAALEADTALAPAGFRHPPMTHAYLGPSFDDDAIERAIQRSGLRYRRVADVAEETASLLAAGKVVCWFQGRMEFGPRALGARSILADPRDPAMHARVNAIKQREPWRPFGPSILAGHEEEWLDGGFDARFMLFTLPVRPERRARIPAVVHVDGTTRPQVVHAETAPLYHAMISAFFAKSGVPLVLNTSFNRRGEPIVCTPQDALAAFRGLGADALAIGSFLVDPALETATGEPADGALAALPGGRRLLLRLSTACDLACAHCTLRDLADDRARRGLPAARTTAEALRALREGRQAGCDELVVLRGEAALRDDLPLLVARARAMGYRRVQLQTSGVSLASRARLEPLLGRGGAGGVDAFEVTVLAADEPTHDALSGRPGTLRAQLTALAALTRAGKDVLAVVPVLAGNRARMRAIVALLQRAGVRRLQLSFPRPVELGAGVPEAGLLRLSDAAPAIARAAQVAAEAGMSVSTEGVPHCHLPEALRGAGESAEDFARHRVDDLHLLHDAADLAREEERPTPPPCRRCAARARCPRTWGSYLELHGSDELRPL
jgi:predicted NodU family carbamoyl transferase/MoaA/NifB/PqqE/SkfB family radical SAM enzyme